MLKPLSDEEITEELNTLGEDATYYRGLVAIARKAERETARQIVEKGVAIPLEGYGEVVQFPEGFWRELKKEVA